MTIQDVVDRTLEDPSLAIAEELASSPQDRRQHHTLNHLSHRELRVLSGPMNHSTQKDGG